MCSADIVFLRANNEHFRRHNYTVVAKPFDVDEMLMKVRELLSAVS